MRQKLTGFEINPELVNSNTKRSKKQTLIGPIKPKRVCYQANKAAIEGLCLYDHEFCLGGSVLEETVAVGQSVKLKIPPDSDINDLKIAAFPDISPVQIAAVQVYAPGTGVPVPPSTKAVEANTTVATFPVIMYEKPLIVIGPNPEQQQNGELRCCSRIHFCI